MGWMERSADPLAADAKVIHGTEHAHRTHVPALRGTLLPEPRCSIVLPPSPIARYTWAHRRNDGQRVIAAWTFRRVQQAQPELRIAVASAAAEVV